MAIQYVDLSTDVEVNRSESNGGYKKCPDVFQIGSIGGDKVIYSPWKKRIYLLDKNDYLSFNTHLDEKRGCDFIDTNLFVPKGFNPSFRNDWFEKFDQCSIFLTTDCNLRCKYCYAKGGEKIRYADINFIKGILDYKLEKSPVKKPLYLYFHGGGEPTLAIKSIKDIVDYVHDIDKRIYFGIQTNGIMPKETLDYLLDKKFSIGVSCDGPPAIQDYHRPLKNGGKSSHFVEESIESIVSNQKTTFVRSTISASSVEKQTDIVEYFHNLGVDVIQAEPIFERGRCLNTTSDYSKTPDLNKFLENYLMARELAEEYQILFMSTFLPVEKFSPSFCGVTIPNFCISTDGYISACNAAFTGSNGFSEFIYGRYDPTDRKVIEDKNKIENLQARTVYNMRDCQNCFLKWNCSGGCPMEAIQVSGNMYGVVNEICSVKKKIFGNYLRYRVKKQILRKKPYIKQSSDRSYLSLFFNEFDIIPTSGTHRMVGNPLIIVPPTENLLELFNRILDHKMSRAGETTLFLLSFGFTENSLTPERGQHIEKFLSKLRDNRIYFKVTKPLPRCVFPKKYLKVFAEYGIPVSCRDCLELFTVQKGGMIEFCSGDTGMHISKYKDRCELNNISSNIQKNFGNTIRCNDCKHYLKKLCNGFCIMSHE
ncbi:MAG: radical SAM protein [Candidatus Altiarchaeota archaeon]